MKDALGVWSSVEERIHADRHTPAPEAPDASSPDAVYPETAPGTLESGFHQPAILRVGVDTTAPIGHAALAS